MSVRGLSAAGAIVVLLGLAACDSGPGGPSTVSGTVTGDAELGAVVLEVTWSGVQGFEGLGGTQVYSAPVASSPNRYRLILVDSEGGDLHFGILVDDVRREGPVATIVVAAGGDNEPMPVRDLRIILER